MSSATLCLLSPEALELHFEGVCYGPIAHTQALGTLLFALRPDHVVLAAANPAFESAMEQVLAAAEATTDVLVTWSDQDEVEARDHVSPQTLATWVHACCKTAPPAAAGKLQSKLAARLGESPWARLTMH